MSQHRGRRIAGGVLGAVATGAVVSATARWSRLAWQRRGLVIGGTDHPVLAELGRRPAGVSRPVTADDGVRLSADVLAPERDKPELTVVFVHGFALDRRCWHFQRCFFAERFGERARLVFYDQRGHGRSERASRASCTIDQLGADLEAVLRALAPDGPVVLVGHSMGGMAIMALAERYSELFVDRVVGVALLCTSAGEVASSGLPGTLLSRRNPLTRTVGALAAWQPLLVERGRKLLSDLIWGVTRAYAYGDRRVAHWLVDFVHAMIGANAVDALIDFVDTLNSHDRLAALPGLKQTETLILSGDADRIIPIRHSEVIAAELPDATMVRLPGVGHMAMLEQSEAVNAALAELIYRADPAGGLAQPARRRA